MISHILKGHWGKTILVVTVLGAVDDPDVVEQISNSSFPYQITKKNLLGPKNELSKPADTKSVYRNPL